MAPADEVAGLIGEHVGGMAAQGGPTGHFVYLSVGTVEIIVTVFQGEPLIPTRRHIETLIVEVWACTCRSTWSGIQRR